MIYRTCPDCGANLDPGERCDCHDEEKPPESCNSQSGIGKIPTINLS